jgi:hypothetical protein
VGEEITEVESDLRDLDRQRRELHRQNAGRPMGDAVLDQLLQEIANKEDELRKALQGLQDQDAKARVPASQRAAARSMLEEWRKPILAGKMTEELWRHVIRSIVKGVRTDITKDGQREFTIATGLVNDHLVGCFRFPRTLTHRVRSITDASCRLEW